MVLKFFIQMGILQDGSPTGRQEFLVPGDMAEANGASAPKTSAK